MNPEHRLAVLFVLSAGCASIKSDIKIVEYPEGMRHISRTVEGSHAYSASAEVNDVNLIVTLSQKSTCEEADVPIVRRKRVTAKSEVPSKFGITGEYFTGIGGVALGGLLIVNPQYACSSTDQNGTQSMVDPQTCATAGWVLIGVGALITTIAAVDSIRITDNEEDLGIHDGAYDASTHECHVGPVPNSTVELQLGNNTTSLRGKTSEGGTVTFSMLDARDDMLPSAGTPVKILIDDGAAVLTLSEKQHRELATNLLDSPHSRIARDLAETTQKSCDIAIDNALQTHVKSDSGDAVVIRSQEAWQRAGVACSALWTTDRESERDTAEAEIIENRLGAVMVALNARDLDRVDDVLVKTPEVIVRLHDDAGVLQYLRRIVGEPTRALVLAKQDVDDAQQRLCRARQIFVRIQGADRWNRFKVEVAKNVSELGQGVPWNIVKLMDAARCE